MTFKIHYYGSREEPFGYKWSTFCGTDMVGSGSLISQDQECKALVTSGATVYFEVYYDQSRSQYFNYGEEFVAEIYINGVPVSRIGQIIINENEIERHYDLSGKQINAQTKGFHIVKAANSTRKLIVK